MNCHGLAEELLSKEDLPVTVTVRDREYVIEGIRTIPSLANEDDTTMHKTLICNESCGNIVR